jgi:cell division septation protein DedD
MSYQFGHIDRDERIDHVEEPQYEEPPPRRNFAGLVLAVAVMAIFAGGLWFAYHLGTTHGMSADDAVNVPLIRAGQDPVKLPPDKAGGMDIPDKDNPLYTRKAGGAPVEHILPLPEQPQPRQLAPPPPPPQTQAPAVPPGSVVAPGTAPAPQHQLAAAPKALPKPPAPAPAAGGTRIQLASVRSPEAARQEWDRLKHDNSDLLGKLTANAVRADLGEKGIYYRVEAGPLTDKAAADRLCKALKERGLGCSLVK